LTEYARTAVKNPKNKNIFLKAFTLIKQLNWGFFTGISSVTHPKLWRELVIPDPLFPEAGDLKRTMSISRLFAAMLDIHGYTKFCQESRKNLSMLHALDQVITKDIQTIANKCQSISRRENGDEIVLISASATDVITAALSIIDYFARSKEVRDPAIKIERSKYADALPILKISVGISGGNTSIPLIITDTGDLSGSLLNTAARLQARANELSPKESKVMITKQVQLNAVAENKQSAKPVFRNKTIYFFDTDLIEFKGVLLPTCELIFNAKDKYKMNFIEEMQRLYISIREARWEQKIYIDLIKVLIKAVDSIQQFNALAKDTTDKTIALDSAVFKNLCAKATYAYVQEEDYTHAIELLRQCILILEAIPDFDRLVLDYAWGILDRYSNLLRVYQKMMDIHINDNIMDILNDQQMKTYVAAQKGAMIYQKMYPAIQKSSKLTNKKPLWNGLIKQQREKMTLTIYSGKK
jgi:hypothetical protein